MRQEYLLMLTIDVMLSISAKDLNGRMIGVEDDSMNLSVFDIDTQDDNLILL